MKTNTLIFVCLHSAGHIFKTEAHLYNIKKTDYEVFVT